MTIADVEPIVDLQKIIMEYTIGQDMAIGLIVANLFPRLFSLIYQYF
jgi:hypothetical protein